MSYNNSNYGGGGYGNNNGGYNNNGGFNNGGGYNNNNGNFGNNNGGYNNNNSNFGNNNGGYNNSNFGNNNGGYNNNNNNRQMQQQQQPQQYVNNNNNNSLEEDVSNNADYQSTTRNIQQIQTSVQTLTKLVQQLGTPRDSMEIRDKIRNCVETTTHLISSESNKVKNLTSLASRTRDSKNKLLFQKLVKEYNSCLQQFKEIAQVATKKEKTTPLPQQPDHQAPQTTAAFGRNNNSNQYNNFMQQQQPYNDDDDDYNQAESQSLMESSRRQQLAQIEAEREYQNSIIQERDEGIRKIEQSIVEINEIFIDLSGLVSEQGVMINTIETSLESTVMNTKEGVQQLREAAKSQRSSRTKMCWIVLILMIVCAVLGLILFFSLRK